MIRKISKLLVIALVVSIFGGCSIDKSQLEQQVKDSLNEELSKNKSAVVASGRALNGMDKCTDISLVKESSGKYQGIATFENGTKKHISVVTDEDKFIWKIGD